MYFKKLLQAKLQLKQWAKRVKRIKFEQRSLTRFKDQNSILDIDVEQAMASKYRLSSLVPNVYQKSDITNKNTDKAILDYEQQLVTELQDQDQDNSKQSAIDMWKGRPSAQQKSIAQLLDQIKSKNDTFGCQYEKTQVKK